MHRPDGMGADRYHERQNMREAAHIESRKSIYAVVTRTMEVISDGFSSREEAEAWLERRLNSYPKPEWSEEDVEVQAIR